MYSATRNQCVFCKQAHQFGMCNSVVNPSDCEARQFVFQLSLQTQSIQCMPPNSCAKWIHPSLGHIFLTEKQFMQYHLNSRASTQAQALQLTFLASNWYLLVYQHCIRILLYVYWRYECYQLLYSAKGNMLFNKGAHRLRLKMHMLEFGTYHWCQLSANSSNVRSCMKTCSGRAIMYSNIYPNWTNEQW